MVGIDLNMPSMKKGMQMRRFIHAVLLSLVMVSVGFAFDLNKAKEDYKGAKFEISSIKEVLYENAPGIEVRFTAPVDKEALAEDDVTLEGGESDHFVVSQERTKIVFPFVTPEKSYTVNVSNTVMDINGQELKYPASEKVKIKPLSPSVTFASSGHILTSQARASLPVSTLNVDAVTMDFFRIAPEMIPSMIERLKRNGSSSYYRLENLQKVGKLVHTGRFDLKPRKNQRTEVNIDLSKIKALKESGAYVAVMYEPGVYGYEYEHAFFMRSDIGLHMRKYARGFDVYVQSIENGTPLKGVEVSVTDKDGNVLSKGKSNKLGRISFKNTPDQHHVMATQKSEFSFLPLSGSTLDLSGLKNPTTLHNEYQIFAWGPRSLYRPGETLEVNMLVRDFDGNLPDALPLSCTLIRGDGSRAITTELQPEETGFYTFKYKTPDSAPTGSWSLSMHFAGGNQTRHAIQVEEFLPERLTLDLFDGKKGPHVMSAPEKIEVPVTSKYLYGAPASGNRLDGFVTARPAPHPFESLSTFFFGDPKAETPYRFEEFEPMKLDKEGKGVLKMENHWSMLASPVNLRINASVYESGGRPITRSTIITLLAGDQFVGVDPQFEGEPDANSRVDFLVGVSDKDGRWIAADNVELKLIRKDREWFWRHTESRGWHWAWNETPVVVFSKSMKTTEGQTEKVSLPISWGAYRLEVNADDSATAYEFETSWSWWGNASLGTSQKPDEISLGFEKGEYRPGDTATLRVNPPEDGLALVTVESSEGVLYTKYEKVTSQGTLVSIATQPEWNRHDLYTSVMVIHPGDRKETPVPSRAFGMVHLPIKKADTRLNISIHAPEKIEPNKTISATIKVNDPENLPANTKVVVALVDVGILNITEFETPDAESFFFAPKRYAVELLDNYGQVIDNIGQKLIRQRFGGGFLAESAELSRGGEKPKSDVRLVSFFSDPVAVSDAGEATVDFELPDFNGKLRWMALAFSEDRFGDADAETTVADKVVTQMAMPRFMADGDVSTMALDLTNMTEIEQNLVLKVTTDGGLNPETHTEAFNLSQDEKATFAWPITAKASSGQGEIHISLTGDGTGDDSISIKRTWRIGLRSAWPGVTRTERVAIEPGGSEKSWKPTLEQSDLLSSSVKAILNLSARPPIDFAGHFEYLLHYPYGCLEQSTSSGYPWVIGTPEALGDMGLASRVESQFGEPYTHSFRLKQINKAVGLVLNRQKSSGGFGLWSPESREDAWLTAYATEFLFDARNAGADVPQQALKQAMRRLSRYAKNASTISVPYSSNRENSRFAVQSYSAYVLAKARRTNLSLLRRMGRHWFKIKDKLKEDCGLSWTYLAAAYKLYGDNQNAKIAMDLAAKQTIRERNEWYGDYGSNVRDLTRSAELMLAHDLGSVGDSLFNLAETLKERNWLSTQERIALFRLALALQTDAGEEWNAEIVSGGVSTPLSHQNTYHQMLDSKGLSDLSEIKAADKTIYASITLTGEPMEAPKPATNGLIIARKFYNTTGEPISIAQMKTGDLALAMLTVTSEYRCPDGLVVELLPAGLELENQNLGLASVKMDEITIDGKTVGELINKSQINHEEFRDDRYVAAVFLEKGKSNAVRLFYLVRAVTPGTYKLPASYVEDMYRPYRFGIGETLAEMKVVE